MTNRSDPEPAPTAADLDHGEVGEVAVLRASDLADFETRAARNGLTTGQLLRRVIGSYLSVNEGSCREALSDHHGETS